MKWKNSLREELADLEEEGIGVRTQVLIEFVVALKSRHETPQIH